MKLKELEQLAKEASQRVEGYDVKEDKVNWTAIKEDGGEIGAWKYKTCYAGTIHSLSSLELHCLPWRGNGIVKYLGKEMHGETYEYFFSLLKKYKLVPEAFEARHLNGANCLLIPRNGWDKHTIYTTLCLYRQCDQKPAEILRALYMWEKLAPLGTHFFQTLQYVSATTAFGIGHYFIAYKSLYGQGTKKITDLANGISLAQFAQLDKEQRKSIAGTTPTYTFFTKMAAKIKSIEVPNKLQILNPEYATYYENPPAYKDFPK